MSSGRVGWSSDGAVVATCGGGLARVYAGTHLAPVREFMVAGTVTDMVVTSAYVVIATEGRLELHHVRAPRVTAVSELADVRALAARPDGSAVRVACGDGVVAEVRLATGRVRDRVVAGARLSAMVCGANGMGLVGVQDGAVVELGPGAAAWTSSGGAPRGVRRLRVRWDQPRRPGVVWATGPGGGWERSASGWVRAVEAAADVIPWPDGAQWVGEGDGCDGVDGELLDVASHGAQAVLWTTRGLWRIVHRGASPVRVA